MHNNHSSGFTLIELLVVIGIIGILSAVVLASLQTARTKGQDAAVQSDLEGIRTQAEIFYANNSNKYSTAGTAQTGVDCGGTAGAAGTMFADSTIKNALTAAYNANGGKAFSCNIDAAGTGYAIAAPLGTANKFWCIDSTGVSRGTLSGGTTAYSTLGGALSSGSLTCN